MAQSLKKVVDGGGQGVEDSSEVELTEDKFFFLSSSLLYTPSFQSTSIQISLGLW